MKLVRFLMNLPSATNQPVTVELKNGNSVNGQVLSCTPTMNLSMKNIKLIQPHQDPQLMPFINIRGNQIRQVLLPDDLNIESLLAKSAVKMKGPGAGPGKQVNKRPARRGGKRAF
ncbi:Sm snRNP core protein Smd1 [Candidozyma auris]|uniref:Sm domain-containing protein n=2 Tax=Candidozyma auris TaxID=498019 RepID=A0A2H0ZZP6_CANAR|nr:hypothetical protein QG37_04201 [[Candida] auris]PIS56110.1 hypothetical protein CJI97_001354 [[Candida] auris]PIS56712.1 hypothetical protein B9J08_001252 [[Candida] auris]PSK76451.1 hypothetical protein CJJ07_003739 [[Candida] auris]GBL51355.1 hypothetical protein CAJCM15448_36290 [[Candida] auris]